MHVLIIPSWYPRQIGDVGGSFFREQAIALKRHSKAKVGLIFPDIRSIRSACLWFKAKNEASITVDEGVPTYRHLKLYGFPGQVNRFKRTYVSAGLDLFEAYIADHGVPDIIHAHSALFAGSLALAIKQAYGVPIVLTEHSTIVNSGLDRNRKFEMQRVVVGSDACIAVSVQLASDLNSNYPPGLGKWMYIPNLVDPAFLAAELRRNDAPMSTFSVIVVALLTKRKRLDLMFSAFALAFKGEPQVTLQVVGDGAELNRLRRLSHELQIAHQICFSGTLTREQVTKSILNADALVLTSSYETFGVVLVEALALGKPVIATRCGGPESIVRDGIDGYLVPTDDPNALATALKKLQRNYVEFSPQTLRSGCEQRFGANSVVSELMDTYSQVIRK